MFPSASFFIKSEDLSEPLCVETILVNALIYAARIVILNCDFVSLYFNYSSHSD